MKKFKKEYLFIIILLVLFITLTILVATGNTYSLDIKVYQLVIGLKSGMLTKILYVITTLASTKWVIVCATILLVASLLFKLFKEYKYALISLILAVISSQAFKYIVHRARPVWKWIEQGGFSYPSGHTISAFALYGAIIILVNKNMKGAAKIIITTLLSVFIFLVGFSRIYFGAHYFTDVLASIILGTLILIIINMFINKEFNNDKDNTIKTI